MVRTIRWATVALLLGAGLLLPVLLRGQVPGSAGVAPAGQPWGPGTSQSTSLKPNVIASSSTPPAALPASFAAPVLPAMRMPDDGWSSRVTLPPSKEPVARATEKVPAPLSFAEPLLEPVPLSRGPLPLEPLQNKASPVQLVSGRPIAMAGQEPHMVASTPGLPHQPTPQAIGPLDVASRSNLSVEILGPPRVMQDDLMPCELVVRNLGNQVLTQVRIDLPLPSGLRLVSAAPMPEVASDRLIWHIGLLEVRGERRLRTDLMVKAADDMALQPVASYQMGAAYRPQVVRPTFTVQQVGAEVVPRGMTTTLALQLTNHGATPLNRVVLWDRLPPGLYHAQGTNIYSEVGVLAPGESRTVKLEVLAHRAGRWVNEVVAEAEGGVKTVSRSALLVAEPSLTVKVSAPERVNVAGEVDYRLEVSNGRQGPAANNIRLTHLLPAGMEVIQATTNALIDAGSKRVTWQLGTLEPGQMQTIFVKARCLNSGAWTSQITLSADQLASAQSECTVLGEGGCRLGLAVQSREDPLEVGGETVYEIRLTNQGAHAGRNVRVSIWVPEGLAPVRADGPTGVRIQQQQVQFETISTLETRGHVDYRLRVRGQRIGAWRMRFEALADQMARPLIEELPVQVLPDARTQRPSSVLGKEEN